MVKNIFSFDDKSAKKLKNKRNVLGGKGANLGEMGRLGLPVPPGFTITTNVCDLFYKNKKKLPNKVIKNIDMPKPKLFTKSESIYSLTYGWSLGTKIIVIIVDNTHFIKEIRLKENPLMKHWTTL